MTTPTPVPSIKQLVDALLAEHGNAITRDVVEAHEARLDGLTERWLDEHGPAIVERLTSSWLEKHAGQLLTAASKHAGRLLAEHRDAAE